MNAPLRLDVRSTPWSHPGSTLAVVAAIHPSDHPGRDVDLPDGVYVLDVSGLRLFRWNGVFRVELDGAGAPDVSATPDRLTLTAGSAVVEATWLDRDSLRFVGRGGVMRLVEAVVDPLDCSVRVPTGDGAWRLQMGEDAHVGIDPVRGHVDVEGSAVRTGADADASARVVTIVPDGDGRFEFVLTQYEVGWARRVPSRAFGDDAADVAQRFADFRAAFGDVPDEVGEVADMADLAAYLLWSGSVGPRGLLRRPSIVSSKHWMHAVWSWDHCFVALGLAHAHPDLAWDQWMTVFDHQHADGSLPDIVHDSGWMRGVVKPPVHGWTLRLLDERIGLDETRLALAYDRLVRLTEWWNRFRRDEAGGLWTCFHGNDTGQDNGTAFDVGFPAVTPDISAYQIVQLDVLADLATRLDRPDEAAGWHAAADEGLERLVAQLWNGERFVVRHAVTGRHVEHSVSATGVLPLVLGDRLPSEVAAGLMDGLERSGLLTPFGVASESPRSQLFERDGYWRGAVWTPQNVIVHDGLRRLGNHALADRVASAWLAACRVGGFAENHDAISGAGLRDPAYTWSAAAFWHFLGR